MILAKRSREAVEKTFNSEPVNNRQRTVSVALRPLQEFLRRVRCELGLEKASVTICLVSDAEIARMNKVFRKHKGPTDVLSFPASERPKPLRIRAGARRERAGEYLGDIAISPATAQRYAKKHGRELPNEIRTLILHGVLHLLGYDHEADLGQMDRLEQKLRKRLGIA
jgi:probable rRNA maturation factor